MWLDCYVMTILSFLAEILGQYKEHAKGETYFVCPFCHHSRPKFAINTHTLKWHCWHCNERGNSLVVLANKLKLSSKQIVELKKLISADDLALSTHQETTFETPELPSEFSPLWKPNKTLSYRHALSYILNRGISVPEIIRYNVGYCATGPYAGRVVVPSYNESNELNYFVARAYYGNTSLKYKNPPISKDVIVFDRLINWKLPVILVEGVFDAMAVKYNAIPLLGKHLPSSVLTKIIEQQTPAVYVMLDADAQPAALELTRKFDCLDIECKNVIPAHKDAGESSINEIWDSIVSARPFSMHDLIAQKLSH